MYVLLSLIQGITEFLPISSSGHLIIASHILPSIEPSLFFDVILHMGTLCAILLFFNKRLLSIIRSKTLLMSIAVCSIPAVIAGLAAKDYIENTLRSPLYVSFALIFGALFIAYADKQSSAHTSILDITWKQALVIGIFQSFALIPGASRSGMTIAGGMLLGLSKKDAAEFSFLAAIPITIGAGGFEIIDAVQSNQVMSDHVLQITVGFILSFLFGAIAIKWLVSYIKNNSFTPFVVYRIVLGIVIAAIMLI